MSAFQVRAARPEDAEGIIGVRTDAWQTAYRGLMPDDYLDAMSDEADQAVAHLRERLRAAASSTLLVGTDTDGRIVGMCAYGPTRDDADGHDGQLHAINVAPQAWGTGLGWQLLSEAQRGLLRRATARRASGWSRATSGRGASTSAQAGDATRRQRSTTTSGRA